MERVRRNVYNFFAVLFVGIVTLTGSIVVFRSTFPEDLSLSEDGFYEIYTAYDYERFWWRVESQDFINGRLMADIYLNDLSDFAQWGVEAPLKRSRPVERFEGDFDGSGHSIYGLYSENGYGLVEKNRGHIHDLFLKKSLIVGRDRMGGICEQNLGQVSDCSFQGELRSEEKLCPEDGRIGGICGRNEGTITGCGYRGTMTLRYGWTKSGVRAGICAENHGQIENCYNLTGLDYYTFAGECYGIADVGVRNSFMRRDSVWSMPEEGGEQITELTVEQTRLFPFFRERESYEWYPDENALPRCLYQVMAPDGELSVRTESAKAEERTALWYPEMLWGGEENASEELWAGRVRSEDNQILNGERLAEGQMEAFAREALRYKGENWKELRFDEAGEGCGLRITDGEQEVNFLAFLPEEVSGHGSREVPGEDASAGELWEVCEEILAGREERTRQQNAGEKVLWRHDTWEILEGSSGRPAGSFLLYRGTDGRGGFFFHKDGILYQALSGNSMEEWEVEAVRSLIERLPTDGESQEEYVTESGLWLSLLESLWVNRLPGDGLVWKDEEVKQAVYRNVGARTGEVPSRERIREVEKLCISYPDQVGTLEDLQKLPGLTGLKIEARGGVNFDLTESMAPRLEELELRGVSMNYEPCREALGSFSELKKLRLDFCGLTDISFVEELKGLTWLSLEGNEIGELSPVEGLRELTSLSLKDNCVRSIASLSSAGKLKELNLADNQVEELAPLESLKGLTSLNVSGNLISDLSPLQGMAGMEALWLDRNLIGDYGTLENMKKLCILSVRDNPGQNIGKLVFTPLLYGGNCYCEEKEELRKAQDYLEFYYPESALEARDMARGDLNGDGITDMAIAGLAEEEEGYRARYVYPFLGQKDGGFLRLPPVDADGCYGEYPEGDSWRGMTIAGQMLVLWKEGYDCDTDWYRREMYSFEEGELRESWQVESDVLSGSGESGFSLYHRGEGVYRDYVIARDEQGHREALLLSEEDSLHQGDGGALRERLEEGLAQVEKKAGFELPEIYDGTLTPLAAVREDDFFRYSIRSFPVKIPPKKALDMVAEYLLEDTVRLPVTGYTLEEIKDSYDRLLGVEVPEEFCLGWTGEKLVMLTYYSCEEKKEGGFTHVILMRECNEAHTNWIWDGLLYFDEETQEITME